MQLQGAGTETAMASQAAGAKAAIPPSLQQAEVPGIAGGLSRACSGRRRQAHGAAFLRRPLLDAPLCCCSPHPSGGCSSASDQKPRGDKRGPLGPHSSQDRFELQVSMNNGFMNLKPRVLTGLLWLPTSVRAMKDQDKQSLSSVGGLLLLLSRFSRVRLCATPWAAAYQAPPSIGFSRQEYWSG